MAGEKTSTLILVAMVVFAMAPIFALFYGLESLRTSGEHVVHAQLIRAVLHEEVRLSDSYTELVFQSNGTSYYGDVSACLYGYFHDRIGDWFNITVNKFGVVLEVRQ